MIICAAIHHVLLALNVSKNITARFFACYQCKQIFSFLKLACLTL
jgi:hypothetical protein